MSDGEGLGNSWASSNSLPDYVASLYYKYGLFVATHSVKVILFAIFSSLLLSTPLWYLPFPGYLPQDYVTSLQNYSVPPPAPELEGLIHLSPSPMPTPLWYQGSPTAYIQQVVVRALVVPWQKGISVGESVRGPLFSVFRLSQIIGDFQLKSNKSFTLASECLLVEEVVRKLEKSGPSLPHYNCLMLSPADLWGRNSEAFLADEDVLQSVKSSKAKHDEETSIADILFGLPSKDIGLSSNPNHPQVISFAFTIALKKYSEEFIAGLEEELTNKFSLHQPVNPPRQFITHVYFPSRISFWEFLILIFYCILFASIYFSFLKMEGLYNKLGLAISLMVSLVASLCIATSLSAHFGLRPLHSKGKYFYPVLAALVGFENSMALVRSVLSSPDHLDVKIRVAKGLSKEGWTITKYFLSMITFITISFFLFIPLVQEICIYGSLVLLCDLYFQLVFVTSILSLDLHRNQDTEGHRRQKYLNPLFRYPSSASQNSIRLLGQENSENSQPCVPNLHRRHNNANSLGTRGEDILAPPQSKPQPKETMPKRLRVTYYVVKMRFFQRMLMCGFVAFIAWMVYTSEIIDQFADPLNSKMGSRDLASLIFSLTNRSGKLSPDSQNPVSLTENAFNESSHLINKTDKNFFNMSVVNSLNASNFDKLTENISLFSKKELKQLKHKRRSFARHLPISHWPALFSYYNISLWGHYLSILPPILLSLPISPEETKQAFNARDPNAMDWVPSYPENEEDSNYDWQEEIVIIPSSKGELMVTAVLLIPALAVMIYATIVLYRVICSRNYAEWRSSRWGKDVYQQKTSEIIGEAVPLVLAGHPHDVECLSTDGSIVVSSCLAGIVCAWDPSTGECLATINRCRQSNLRQSVSSDERHSCNESLSRSCCHHDCSIYNSSRSTRDSSNSIDNCSEGRTSPSCFTNNKTVPMSQSFPSLSMMLPDLSPTIDLNFKDLPSSNTRRMRNSTPFQFKPFESQTKDDDDHTLFLEQLNTAAANAESSSGSSNLNVSTNHGFNKKSGHSRNLSTGSIPPRSSVPFFHSNSNLNPQHKCHSFCSDKSEWKNSPVWALEVEHGMIFVGTGKGVLEIWNIFSSSLKCFHDDLKEVGITSIKVSGNHIVTARLNGSVDIFLIEEIHSDSQTNNKLSASMDGWSTMNPEGDLRLVRFSSVKAHQQPITVLTCDNTRIITGSHDHTLKVFSLQDGLRQFTLHGHYGPVTSLALGGPLIGDDASYVGINVDLEVVGSVVASGAQDGSLCVWDLQTGVCVYSVQAHDGAVITLTCTSSYILSLGADDKLCVWERFQGHLLNTLIMGHMYCSSMVTLTNRLLITSQQGSLTVWDITAGTPVRIVRLGDRDQTVFIKHLLPVAGSIVCDYGNQLRVVRLPVAEKFD